MSPSLRTGMNRRLFCSVSTCLVEAVADGTNLEITISSYCGHYVLSLAVNISCLILVNLYLFTLTRFVTLAM